MNSDYPFVAIVGQDELLLGMILNIVNPQLGGILIKGVKGSGKSTAVYAMPDIIPEIKVLKNCNFNCDPDNQASWCDDCKSKYSDFDTQVIRKKVENISVPLSITEDSLLGSIDIELLLKDGKQRFIPGLLTKAHRQILYIDEVNLMPDHIIDDILDVSATGWNKIEREGFSISHPSEFLMVGTMNPEEGELRPQILDRFPLSVEVSSVSKQNLRKEIIKRNLACEKDAANFKKQFSEETENLKCLIEMSRKLLNEVEIDPVYYDLVVDLCTSNKIDGHRADISIIKTAKTYAAFELKNQIAIRHLKQAAKFVLLHRTRDGGLSKPLKRTQIDDFFDNIKLNKHQTNEVNEQINKDLKLFSDSGLVHTEKK